MYLSRDVGAKGQVVVPQEIREKLGIVEGTELQFDLEGERIVLTKKGDALAKVEAFCSFGQRHKKILKPLKPGSLKKILEEQYLERFPNLR